MRFHLCCAAPFVSLLLACGHGSASLPPTDVPMTVGVANNTLRFSVSVQVGDAPPFDAILDTGSAGLQIVPGALPDSAYDTISTTPFTVIFGNALRVDSVVALARVQIGGVSTPVPIPVARITSFECAQSEPGCSVDTDVKDHFTGFSAILGVGMRTFFNSEGPEVGNPIVQLPGSPSFVIQAPSFPGGVGNLRISPAKSEIATFSQIQLQAEGGLSPLPNGTSAWNDLAVPSCVSDKTTATQYCGGALLDTGSPSTEIAQPGYTGDPTLLASGDNIEISIGDSASPAEDYSFTIGKPPRPGLDQIVIGSTNGVAQLNLGAAPFFLYDVWFDQSAGVIGLASR